MKYIEQIPPQYTISVVIVLVSIIVVLFKVIPPLLKCFNLVRNQVNTYESLNQTVQRHTAEIDCINKRMGAEQDRYKQLKEMTERQQRYIEDSLDEREIMLRGILSIIQSLHELGVKNPTSQAEKDIQSFLLRKTHDVFETDNRR